MTVEGNAAVILNHNDNLNTLRLAKCFAGMSVIGKIAVVDNSGIHGLNGNEDELKNPKVEFVITENSGYARGNNDAVHAIEAKFGLPEFLIISNPDVEVSGESIEQCVSFLTQNEKYAVAAPHNFRSDGKPHHLSGWKERTFLCDLAYSSGILSRLIGMYRETYPPSHWQTPYSIVDCVSGAFFLIRSAIFKEAGYFDEKTFLFYEEDILGYTLKRLGYKEAVLNTCSFIHFEGVSAGKNINYIKKYCAMQKSRLYFHRKYLKTGLLKMTLLYAATGLGFIESLIKTVFKKQ